MKAANVIKLLVLFALPLVLGLSASDPLSLQFRLFEEAEPYVQTVTGWMMDNTATKLLEHPAPATPDQVRSYFAEAARLQQSSSTAATTSANDDPPAASSVQAQLDRESPGVEQAIQRSIAVAAGQDGLDRSLGGLRVLMPPVLFRFETLPNLLVVSPRDRIDRVGSVLLRTRLAPAQVDQIEGRAGTNGLSSLVTPIGGLGVYPSMVPENSNALWTFETVAHEWTHQFLAARPLGFRFAFGDERDSRMITINETVADTVGHELGDRAYSQYYSETPQVPQAASARDQRFRVLMRGIRTRVDELLAGGKVDEAERFMEQSRQELAQQGYYIRKLNQAYFAFYGSYAEEPSLAGRTGQGISDRVKNLRRSSANLGDFLWRVSSAGSYEQFLAITGGA